MVKVPGRGGFREARTQLQCGVTRTFTPDLRFEEHFKLDMVLLDALWTLSGLRLV